jgi:hypothetical protein
MVPKTRLMYHLAAAGTAASDKTIYLLGGYGSYKGQQMLNPQNQYNLMRFEANCSHIIKIRKNNQTTVKLYSLLYPPDSTVGFSLFQ